MRVIDAGAFCCVIDAMPKTDTASTTTTSATSIEEQWAGADYCFKFPFSAGDYSNQVSSTSTVTVATNIRTPADEATSTTTSTSSGLSAASGSSFSNVSMSVTPTTNAAMPVATAKGVVLGGARVAAALFVLLYGIGFEHHLTPSLESVLYDTSLCWLSFVIQFLTLNTNTHKKQTLAISEASSKWNSRAASLLQLSYTLAST